MMTTCQKCIHYEICKTRIDFNEYALEMQKFKCPNFKNNAEVVEVKHGEWLKTDAYPHRIYCSLCYEIYVTNEEVIRGRSDGHPTYCREAKYCPHCGAKMDLKEVEADLYITIGGETRNIEFGKEGAE